MLQAPAQSRRTQRTERGKMNELALFAGAGGGILGGMLLGWRTVAAVEIEDYPRRVLLQRQADGILPRFPVWDNVCTFDGHPWRGKVDVISGGFPCQDISAAGKGAGLSGDRSGLWSEMARIISEVRPRFVLVENSPLLVSRGLDVVLSDFAEMGYDARWGVVGAIHAGAPHKRDRIWIVANSGGERAGSVCGEACPDADNAGRQEQRIAISDEKEHKAAERGSWWATEPELGRMADGVANRVDRLKAIGNGQVPAVAQLAFNLLSPRVNAN